MSGAQAVIALITGVEPLKGKDIWAKQESIKEMDNNIRKAQQQYSIEYARALRDGDNNDPSGYDFHMKQATAILQTLIPPTEWSQTLKSASRSVGFDLEQRVNEKEFMKQKNNPEMFQRQYQ
jgi:hypothetical protein